MKVQPYKQRVVRREEEVWVYRNLMRTSGVWYSLLQRQLVVGHAEVVYLRDVRLVVREAGRQQTLSSGVKSVHAFAVGMLCTARPTWLQDGFSHRARYTPQEGFQYIAHEKAGDWEPVATARAARLDETGVRLWSPNDVVTR